MTNKNFSPRGIEPWLWKKIQAKRRRELTQELRTIWATDQILWAVVKGIDTHEKLTTHFSNWKPETLSRRIEQALRNNHIHLWGKKYHPIQAQHKDLKRRLSLR